MSKKIIIIIVVTVIINIGLLYIVGRVPSYNNRYYSLNETACLTFYDDKNYDLYDCDSEPTDYSFDSEKICTYDYDFLSSKARFKCKEGLKSERNTTIKIMGWYKHILIFRYKNTIKIFYSII